VEFVKGNPVVKLERKAVGLHLEECQVAKFNVMDSAIRTKAD